MLLSMKNDFFYGLPYLFLIVTAIVIYRLIDSNKRRTALTTFFVVIAVSLGTTYVAYHLPVKNILHEYSFDSILLKYQASGSTKTISEEVKIDRILEMINSQFFVRDAKRAAGQLNVYDEKGINLLMWDLKHHETIQLYLRVQRNDTALLIGNQVYEARDPIGFNQQLQKELEKFGLR